MSSEAQPFSLKEVQDIFSLCVSEDGQISMKHYVEGWQALVRFMNRLGIVFSFISKDADNKINILLKFLMSEKEKHYFTIQSMVKYEHDNGHVDLEVCDRHPESGCRTLLRLHRALLWLHLFLVSLINEEDREPSDICSQAYSETLAQHHDWIIQNAAKMAFCLLPLRKDFFEIMNAGSQEQVVAMLRKTLPLMENVYNITESVYADYNFLELP